MELFCFSIPVNNSLADRKTGRRTHIDNLTIYDVHKGNINKCWLGFGEQFEQHSGGGF